MSEPSTDPHLATLCLERIGKPPFQSYWLRDVLVVVYVSHTFFLKKTYMCTKTSFLLGPSIFTLAVRFRLSTSFLQKTHTFYPMKIDPLQLQIRFV